MQTRGAQSTRATAQLRAVAPGSPAPPGILLTHTLYNTCRVAPAITEAHQENGVRARAHARAREPRSHFWPGVYKQCHRQAEHNQCDRLRCGSSRSRSRLTVDLSLAAWLGLVLTLGLVWAWAWAWPGPGLGLALAVGLAWSWHGPNLGPGVALGLVRALAVALAWVGLGLALNLAWAWSWAWSWSGLGVKGFEDLRRIQGDRGP